MFIGEGVVFDTNYPEDITIEEGVTLTVGCVIITHFVEIDDNVRRHYCVAKSSSRKTPT